MPKAPKAPPPMAERQATQNPQEMLNRSPLNARRRRGLWASIFTGPQGVAGAPSVTGTRAMGTGQ